MPKNYRLQVATLNPAWDAFVSSSADGTAFLMSSYLANLGCRLGLYHCYNANELRAVIAVVESHDGESAILDDLLIYSGICFGPPTSEQNRAQQTSERHEISTFIAEALAERYKEIKFDLAPSVHDVRSFLWHNYGHEHRRYSVDVRYTSYLDISDFAYRDDLTQTHVYKQASVTRRQQIRYVCRNKLITDEICNVDLFLDFYRRTMLRQGADVSRYHLDRIGSLTDALLNLGVARMFISKTPDNIAGSIAVYAFDHRRAYYLFGASDPDLRDTPTGTAVLWDAFSKLSAGGVGQVDLEGVNSPRRGWFKLSFGGELQVYYRISRGS